MLRPRLSTPGSQEPCEDAWRASSGTAAVLGLRTLAMDAAPTTAYLMLGSRCLRNCAFCAQARESSADASALSRVLWPAFPREDVAAAVAAAHRAGDIRRACFQVTVGRDSVAAAAHAARLLAGVSPVPICVSVSPRDLADVAGLLNAGAQRVTIALDAATEPIHRRAKSGSWAGSLALLEQAVDAFPGRIGTHLIAGLGETERDLTLRIAALLGWGVRVALFAFTPVRGTAMENCPPPSLQSYRRVQAAHWLLAGGWTRAEALRFGAQGEIISYGLPEATLVDLLAAGEAFRTSGCPDCNRPYYNERPGGLMYNYPRPLTTSEARRELAALLATLRPH
ncbi:MAG: radical SAM protein [Chloroflexi bacterium]|nr:radical SAM protein [Chloroflexota bacterium]